MKKGITQVLLVATLSLSGAHAVADELSNETSQQETTGQHPDSAQSYHKISQTYAAMGDDFKAYQLSKRALTTFLSSREKKLSARTPQLTKHFLASKKHFIDFLLLHSTHYHKDLIKGNKPQEAAALKQTTINDWLASSDGSLPAINSQDIAKALNTDDLYIGFAKTDDGYYRFTIDHQNTVGFNAYSRAESEKIDEAIRIFQAMMGRIAENQKLINHSEDKTKQTLSALYKHLLTQELLAATADKQSLIISLEGALRLLPFEALFNEANNEALIESKNIRYIASDKELVRLSRQSSGTADNESKDIVIFANPDFGSRVKLPRDAAINSKPTNEDSLLSYFNSNYRALPGTQKEADGITKVLTGKKVQGYYQEYASKANLLAVSRPNILHLVTHSFFLTQSPNHLSNSGLIMAGFNQSLKTNQGDGLVTALELSGLDLTGTNLVVLSGSDTDKVDPDSTDTVSRLVKAVVQAGATNVIASLWSVADDETAALMTVFYKASKENKQYAKALKESKLKLLDQGLHPYYWAAFVLSGL